MGAIRNVWLSVRQDGIKVAPKHVGQGIAWRTAPVWQLPGRKIRQMRMLADIQFDRKFGVDTSGYVGVRNLDISPDQKESAIYYEPTPAAALRAMLRAVPVAHEEFTFIDFGSGKGKALLLASEYPYKRIIGVEASRKLNDIALGNFRAWKSSTQRCCTLESHCMDAREFPLPAGPLVIFFFRPFRPPISNQVIERIAQSFAADPRPMRIVHYGRREEFRTLVEQVLGFKRRNIYTGRPLAAIERYKGTLFTSVP